MDVKVTKEDQGYINEFSRLHQKTKVIKMEINAIKEKLENTKDAKHRCDELFGENTKILIGETFMEDKATQMLNDLEQKQKDEIKLLDEKVEKNTKRLNELKIILYSKFKNAINLDE